MRKKKIKIGIIGFGNFGQLIAGLLLKYSDVYVYQYKNKASLRKRAREMGVKLVDLETIGKCDVIILAATISKTENAIKELSPLVKKGALVVDTCSIKVLPCQWMKNNLPKGTDILGTHPMWGPDSVKINKGIKGLKIVLCPIRLARMKFQEIKRLLQKAGFKVIVMSPQEHDRQAADSQTLAQFVGKILADIPLKDIEIATLGYEHLRNLLPFVINNTDQLFCDLQNYNPYAASSRKKFLKSGQKVQEQIRKAQNQDSFSYNRDMIDEIDGQIFDLFKKRFEHVKRIGKEKKKKGMKIIDKNREKKILQERTKKTDLDRKFIKELYKLIFQESYKQQK
jgi:prephenate dehydrogenase